MVLARESIACIIIARDIIAEQVLARRSYVVLVLVRAWLQERQALLPVRRVYCVKVEVREGKENVALNRCIGGAVIVDLSHQRSP